MIYLLTQDRCAKCEAIKMFLEKGLSNKYADKVTIVHRQTNEKLFMDLVKKHNIFQTPSFIYNDESTSELLSSPEISQVEPFLKKYN